MAGEYGQSVRLLLKRTAHSAQRAFVFVFVLRLSARFAAIVLTGFCESLKCVANPSVRICVNAAYTSVHTRRTCRSAWRIRNTYFSQCTRHINAMLVCLYVWATSIACIICMCGVRDACHVYTEFSFITFHLFAIVIKVGQWNVQVHKRKFVNVMLNVFHFISSPCLGGKGICLT